MRNEPTIYHVRVCTGNDFWCCVVAAFNREEAVFRAGIKAGQVRVPIEKRTSFYVHQDKGLGCCQPTYPSQPEPRRPGPAAGCGGP